MPTNGSSANGASANGTQPHVNGSGATAGGEVENVIIIGSGPAGFTAGLYTGRASLEPLLFTGHQYGGQVSITYDVENYPGFPEGLGGPELVEKMREQAQKFGTRVEFDYVTEIDTEQHPFVIKTQSGKEYRTLSVILTTGARARLLDVPGEQELTGRGVSYCATCDGAFFRGKDVVVVGGGDSAVEEGLFLTRFASRVRIIHRRDSLRASQIMQDRAFKNEKVEFIWNTVVTEILGGEDKQVVGVKTRNLDTGAEEMLDTQGVFVYIGHLPNNQLLQGKFDLDEDGHLITDRRMRTNVPGIFAGGEIMDKVFKQVATSVGQGCAAAMQTEKFLADLEDQEVDLSQDPRVNEHSALQEGAILGSWN